MYVVLASNATITIVCMGWRHAGREIAWRRGVTLLFNHIGVAAVSAAGVPRSLLGRREEPIIVPRYGEDAVDFSL
jgi:hypothetical protein